MVSSTSQLSVVSNIVDTPHALDTRLHACIKRYTAEHSMKKLAIEVEKFVRGEFRPAYNLVADGKLEPQALEDEIKSNIPSRTYIMDYANGRPICLRYTNTLAKFFDVKFSIGNYNACDNFFARSE